MPKFDSTRVDAWVALWNTYDLRKVDELFVRDDRLTYFSSEKEGVIRGGDAVRRHHEGFGFVPGGGGPKPTRLWLENVTTAEFAGSTTAVVSAVWYFARDGRPQVQRGPVTLVFVHEVGGAWRIAHAHFGNYPPRA